MKIYQLLIPNYELERLIRSWTLLELCCDLRLRRAKTRGCTVVETSEPMMAENIRICYDCQNYSVRTE